MGTATMACSLLLCGGVVTDDGDGDGTSDALYGRSGALATASALAIPHPLLAPVTADGAEQRAWRSSTLTAADSYELVWRRQHLGSSDNVDLLLNSMSSIGGGNAVSSSSSGSKFVAQELAWRRSTPTMLDCKTIIIK